MLTLFTDFQAIDSSGCCWILRLQDGTDLQEMASALKIRKGDRCILDAHEDFIVLGTLDIKYVSFLARKAWVAHPDWLTRTDKLS